MIRLHTEPLLAFTEGKKRSRTVARVAIGSVLLTIGLTTLLSRHHGAALGRPLGGLALVIAAIVVVLGPWWLRIARDLVVERQARVRAEERAEMATRVHDSVLQTLALIQRRADDPQKVIQLARAQERELRSWLFDGRAPGAIDGQGLTFAAGVRLIQQEVEAQHEVAVEAVTVGDCELDDDLRALLAAAREATVNAVKWSGAGVVSIFAEVEPAEVSLFVRDRGRGFDPAAVPGDRKGLAESIHARMARRGGVATVRSVTGEGTEVSLTMPRAAGERQPSRT
jgi:signal transduction histidine kinase